MKTHEEQIEELVKDYETMPKDNSLNEIMFTKLIKQKAKELKEEIERKIENYRACGEFIDKENKNKLINQRCTNNVYISVFCSKCKPNYSKLWKLKRRLNKIIGSEE